MTAPICHSIYVLLDLFDADVAAEPSLPDLLKDTPDVPEHLEAFEALLLLDRDLLFGSGFLDDARELLRELFFELLHDLPLEHFLALLLSLLVLRLCFSLPFPFPLLEPLLRLLEFAFRGVFGDAFLLVKALGRSGNSKKDNLGLADFFALIVSLAWANNRESC